MAPRTPPPRLWDRGAMLRLLAGIATAVVLYYVTPIDQNGNLVAGAQPVQTAVAVLVFLVLIVLIGRQARYLALGGRPARVQGLLLLIVIVVLFFSLAYLRMADQFSGLDTKTDSLYFTMSTLATVGFGDVRATGQGARAVVIVQMVFDLVYLATLASVITGLVRRRVEAVRDATAETANKPGAAPPGDGHDRRHGEGKDDPTGDANQRQHGDGNDDPTGDAHDRQHGDAHDRGPGDGDDRRSRDRDNGS